MQILQFPFWILQKEQFSEQLWQLEWRYEFSPPYLGIIHFEICWHLPLNRIKSTSQLRQICFDEQSKHPDEQVSSIVRVFVGLRGIKPELKEFLNLKLSSTQTPWLHNVQLFSQLEQFLIEGS